MKKLLPIQAKWVIVVLALGLCAYYLSTQFKWQAAFSALSGTDWPRFFIVTGLLFIANVSVRTLRWLILLRSEFPVIRYRDLFIPTLVSISLAMVTPGQIGEALKIEAVKRNTGRGWVHGLGTFLVERAVDLFVVCIMAACALNFVLPESWQIIDWRWLVLLAIAAIGALPLLSKTNLLNSLADKLGEERLPLVGIRTLLMTVLLTVLAWALVVLAWHEALASMEVAITLGQATALVSLTILSIVATFIPGGAGVSEVVISEMLIQMGIDTPFAQGSALILRVLGFWWVLIGLSNLPFWFLAKRRKPHHDSH